MTEHQHSDATHYKNYTLQIGYVPITLRQVFKKGGRSLMNYVWFYNLTNLD